MDKMIFTADRTSLAEGDIIGITWDCSGADSVNLTIDNGYKASSMALTVAGNKRFRLKEIPVDYRDRPEGSLSKLNTFTMLGVSFLLTVMTI